MKIIIDTNIIYDYLEINKKGGKGYSRLSLEKLFKKYNVLIYEGSLCEFIVSEPSRYGELKRFVSAFKIEILKYNLLYTIIENLEFPNIKSDKIESVFETSCDFRARVEAYFLSFLLKTSFSIWASSTQLRKRLGQNNFEKLLDIFFSEFKNDFFEHIFVLSFLSYTKKEKDPSKNIRFWLEHWSIILLSKWNSILQLSKENKNISKELKFELSNLKPDNRLKNMKKKIQKKESFFDYFMKPEFKELFEIELSAFKSEEFSLPNNFSEYLCSFTAVQNRILST
jgi:hypothetical protein